MKPRSFGAWVLYDYMPKLNTPGHEFKLRWIADKEVPQQVHNWATVRGFLQRKEANEKAMRAAKNAWGAYLNYKRNFGGDK